ncbi:MAG: hypothetical protein Q8P41_18580 [Pseudomonadota bacterium]|nr:hypothetical protein [Pseudomonadota bacterium]
MKRVAAVAAVPCAIALAAALGVPVASWAAAVGMLCFVFAACALLIGADDAGKSLLKGFLACLAAALLANAGGAAMRAGLGDPWVQGTLCALLALAALLGGAYLAAKGASLDLKKAPRPKLPFMERSAVVEPAPAPSARVAAERPASRAHRPPSADPFASAPGTSRRREGASDDDLGLFGRGGRS